MKFKFLTLYRFLKQFGIWNGLYLYLKFTLGSVEKISLPHIKYPIKLRANTSDIPVFNEVFLQGGYNIEYNKNPKVVIDGGANIGLFSIKLKNDFPDAQIICVEPDPDNFQTLKKNLSSYPNTFFENSGIWNKSTKLKVYDKHNMGKWAMIVEEDLENGNIDAVSIGSLFEKYDIQKLDILKLDVEGSEKQIFSDNYQEWLPKVKMILIELHDGMELGCSKSFFTAINNAFEKYSFNHLGENIIIINESFE